MGEGTATGLRLELFGPPRLAVAGRAVPLAWQRPAALAAYLATVPGWVSRDALAALLRPDTGDEAAKGYLRRLLFRARKEAYGAGIEAEAQRVRWAGGSDVRDFLAACDAARWERAAELACAPFAEGAGALGEAGFDDWLDNERLRLRDRLRAALTAQIDALSSATDRQPAAALLQRLVDADPLDEDGVQFALARAASEVERRIALAAFDTLQRRLAYEMALRPLPGTQALAARLRERSFETAAPASRAVAADVELAPFVGRATELAALGNLLRSPARLVTLLGPGGVGKTRLARAALSAFGGDFAHGAVFIDLAPVTTDAGAGEALVEALGAPASGAPVRERLRHWLGAREMLVVVDNVEQLVDAVGASFAALIEAAPRVRWLATSREPFGIAAEHRLPLDGLASTAVDSAAVELLRLHARRHGHETVAGEEAGFLRIAQAVEGSPLALELAAPLLAVMAPDELATLLERDLGVLEDDAPDRRDAHHSLRAVFEGSWLRLAEAERGALAALTVFRGGFDRDAARAVCGTTLAQLLRLVGRSLVRRVGARRFALHLQVAQFAGEKLDPGAASRLRSRHAEHYLRWLAARPDLQLGTWPRVTLEAIRVDFDNLRAAWLYAADAAVLDLLELARESLLTYVMTANRYEEGIELFARAVSQAAQRPVLERALLRARCTCEVSLGQHDAARELVPQLAAQAKDPSEVAHLAIVAAMLAGRRGDFDEGRRLMREALDAAAAADDPYLRVRAELNLGITEWSIGRPEAAEPYLLAALRESERLEAVTYRARALRVLGILRHAAGDYDAARELMEKALGIFETMGDAFDTGYSLRNLAWLEAYAGRHEVAVTWAKRALALWRELGAAGELAESEFALAYALARSGRPDEARVVSLAALRAALRLDFRPLMARVLALLGRLCGEAQRAHGLLLLTHAIEHPALRGSDKPILEGLRDELRPTSAELGEAAAAARAWTIEDLASRELARAPDDARTAAA